MSNLIGVRLNKEDYEEYLRIIKENSTNPSAMTAKIVHDWLHFHRTKQYRGDVTLSGEILKKRHEAIKKTEIDKIVKHNAKVIISEMEFQVDNLDFAEVSRRILDWNRENGIAMIMRDRKDHTVFMQKHSFGIIWSEIQCKMYCKMFEDIGETVRSMKFDSGSFSFEIFRQN